MDTRSELLKYLYSIILNICFESDNHMSPMNYYKHNHSQDYMIKVIILAHMGITLTGACETLGIMKFSLNRWQHLMVGFADHGPIYPKGDCTG